MHDRILEQLLEPVRIPILGLAQILRTRLRRIDQLTRIDQCVHLAVDTAGRSVRYARVAQPALGVHLLVDRHLVLRIHDVEVRIRRDHAVGEFTRIVDAADTGTSLLGGDDDHTGHGAGTVDRGCGTVLEDVEALDVLGIQTGDGRTDKRRGITRREVLGRNVGHVLHDDTVDNPQRFRATANRRCTADADLGRRTEGTRYVLHRHTGRTALKTAADISQTRNLHIVCDKLVGCSGEQALVHCCHTRYDHCLHSLRIGFEFHADVTRNGNLLRLVTYIGDDQNSIVGEILQLEFSIQIGRDTDRRVVLEDDRSTDDRCVGFIDNQTLHLSGLSKRTTHYRQYSQQR